MTLRIVAISDTHGLHDRLEVPDGDLLIHAGDLTRSGELSQVPAFDAWIAGLPHPHKIVIAGNHDFCFERAPAEARRLLRRCTYLQDEAVTVAGLKLYGSPWQPWFYDFAFNLRRGEALREKWARIPLDTDVLITHGPPQGHGGLTSGGVDAGCEELLAAVQRIRPRLHVFGHIHEGYGVTEEGRTRFVNASVCNLGYEPLQAPVVIELVVSGERESP
ncbi:MAG: metallophosphatase domain-containing protein [bacterium]